MSTNKKEIKSTSLNGKPNEELYAGFQLLRNEQRIIANKLSEMEAELNEHKIVIDTLKTVDPKRKCYRMVGGILCERTVEEVLPILIMSKEELTKVIATLNEQLAKKGVEVNEFKEKHNIRFKGQEDSQKQEESEETKRNAVVINPIYG